MNFPRILKKRKGYIVRIKPFMQKSVVKVLTGQRRVGKSFLLYQLIEEILAEEPDANIIYVNYSMKIMIYTLQVVTPRCFQENSPLI